MSQVIFLEYRGDIALIQINNPPVNALSVAVRQGMIDAFDELRTSAVKAIILYGANRGFSGGADIVEFAGGLQLPDFQEVIECCESSSKPVIAAIHGIALGGGLELALSCAYRVSAPDAKVGLPEAKLGLLPGAGGTQRLPRIIGVEEATAWILSGASVPAKKAADAGVIDAIIEGDLIEGALAFAHRVMNSKASMVRDRNDRITGQDPGIFEKLRANAAKQSFNLVAPFKIIDAIETACRLPIDEGIKRERELFNDCLESTQSKGLVHAFFAEREVWKIPGLPSKTATREIAKTAVIGAGTMGSGIAMAFLNADIETVLIEANEAALERGVGRIRDTYAAAAAKGRLSEVDLAKRMALLHPTVELARVADVDLILEAVFERMDIKQEIFRQLDQLAKPGAVLASNTSMLDVNEIAAVTKRPQDVLGLHFFSPANVMPLLEIVRGEQTSGEVLATALAVTRRIKKIPAVVGVCDGFVGNRMILKYFREAEFMAAEGASLQEIDRALTEFGLAMGPFAMSDMAGVDVRWEVEKRQAASRPEGERYSDLVSILGKAGRFGQKTNAGFYRYAPGSRTALPDPELDALISAEAARQSVQRHEISAEEIVQRCLYALVNEGAYILEEGVAARAGDIDIVYIYGYGFPAYRGGPMLWADLIGLPKVLSDIQKLQKRFGDYWKPSALLTRLAAENGRFNDPSPGAKS